MSELGIDWHALVRECWEDKGMAVTIGVPTKSRPEELGRLLASLHAQTWPYWRLVIVNDGKDEASMLDASGRYWLERIMLTHEVVVLEGLQINQCASHNMVLWDPACSSLVLRLDDDLILDRDFLEELVFSWVQLEGLGKRPGALGGLYFDERNPRGSIHPIPTAAHHTTSVGRTGAAYPTAQMVSYADDDPFRAEHIYSASLYSRDAMRQVGGWPQVYSIGFGQREETDGTYRLHLAGYENYVIPTARAKHEHSKGGRRSMGEAEIKAKWASDDELWMRRVGRLRGVNWHPTIALCSYHTSGIGGAQRLFYSLLRELEDMDWLGGVEVIALGQTPELASPEQVERDFGLKGLKIQPGDLEKVYDLVISLGHEPPNADEIPPRRFHIHYNLFPTLKFGLPMGVDRHVSISLFSASYLNQLYRRRATIVYPYVEPVELPKEIEKQNRILIVGAPGRAKRIPILAQAFLEMDLPDGTELHIVVPEIGEDNYGLHLLAEAPSIFLHEAVSDEELKGLYLSSKLLWAGRGYHPQGMLEGIYMEHFGYTPIEASLHYCIPVAFDGGGYQETAAVRWASLDQLERLTRELLTDGEKAQHAFSKGLELARVFSRQAFRLGWEEIIASVNGLAWDSQISEWRRGGRGLKVEKSAFHVACISDSPYLPTGYSVIAKEVMDGFIEAGMKVHVFALNDHRADLEGRYYRYWPNPESQERLDVPFQDFIKSYDFDAVWVCRDPHTGSKFVQGTRTHKRSVPIVAYVTQEGEPVNVSWSDILHNADRAYTMSKSSQKAINERFPQEVGWVYPGLQHGDFRRLPEEERHAIRRILGWEERFIILNVATNKRHKRHPLLMKAFKRLRDQYHYDDLLLLLHTNPVGKRIYHGHDLRMWGDRLGLSMGNEVAFTPGDLLSTTNVDALLNAPIPRRAADVAKWMSLIGMTGLYNLADVYVDVSSAEGFCMPNIEALACGTPVISVEDNYVRSEVLATRGAILIPPSPTPDEWVTGGDLLLVSDDFVAECIHNAKETPDAYTPSDQIIKELNEVFDWDKTREAMVNAIRGHA